MINLNQYQNLLVLIYIVDDMNKNYVCVGSKDNYNQSYTLIIE